MKVFLKKKNKQQYGREQYKNLLADEKQKFLEYRKKYYKMRKNTFLIIEKNIKK